MVAAGPLADLVADAAAESRLGGHSICEWRAVSVGALLQDFGAAIAAIPPTKGNDNE
jgi:hypothetical protein